MWVKGGFKYVRDKTLTIINFSGSGIEVHYVYILQSYKTNGYYFGSSSDVFARVEGHNRGCCYTTSRSTPWKLIWYGAFDSKQKAEEFEKYLKTGSGYAFSRKRLMIARKPENQE